MDPTLLSLLDSIPQKTPRSKLETHRALIRHLRRRGCTYRDIARILHERVGLDVAVNTIPLFHQGSRKTPKVGAVRTATVRTSIARNRPHGIPKTLPPESRRSRPKAQVEQRAKPKHFHFDESEPLELVGQGGSR